MKHPGVSVIICCYNSAKRLPKTLDYLNKQVVDNLCWEIVVVDNASTDETQHVAKSILNSFNLTNFSWVVLPEDRPGLSFARHTGVSTSKYDITLFCDDDNWLEKSYVWTAYQHINCNNKIGALGGKNIAVSDLDLPEWFDNYKDFFAVGDQGTASGDITCRGYVWGAGLVTRRNLFLTTITEELPSILSDRKGNELSSGGDNEYCQRLVLLGYRLHYNAALMLWHYMTSERLTIEYRDRLMKALEVSSGIVYNYTEAIQFKQSTKLAKAKMVAGALTDIAANKLIRRKASHKSFKILYLLLGISYKTDLNLKVIKRFYNA